jgi:capsular exopolysaccharide synthesis family protein
MSRAYDALKRAEIDACLPEFTTVSTAELNGEGPVVDVELDARLRREFERLRVLLMRRTTPAGEPLHSLMVAAVGRHTGATTTTVALAASLAGESTPTLLVDANLRAPRLRPLFGLNGGPGLGDVLAKEAAFGDTVYPTDKRRLSVLPAGRVKLSAELLAGPGLDALLDATRAQFRFAVFDVAPLPESLDACALASRMDAVLLLVQGSRTSAADARDAARAVEDAGGRILGVVLNRQRASLPGFLRRLLAHPSVGAGAEG